MMTVRVKSLPALVMFEFASDDPQLRKRLCDAILCNQCPDFECSLGSPNGTGSSYTALWRVEHADAVRSWAQSIGLNILSTDGSLRNEEPLANIKLPDIGDIAPGGVVAPCLADAERLLPASLDVLTRKAAGGCALGADQGQAEEVVTHRLHALIAPWRR